MESNNKVYSKFIGEAVQELSGIETNADWEWCFRENSTYLDCPIANYEDGNVTMIVAAYNPSTDPTNYTSIAVPHPNYNVQVFNATSKKFENPMAAVICDPT